jgi:RNA polymerase sigma-70 factor, ECF subfamily
MCEAGDYLVMPASIEQVIPATDAVTTDTTAQDRLYQQAAEEYAAPLMRLVRAHESDPAVQADLQQEIHLALWRSFASFDQRCSLRTWVYRVAHNTAATHILRSRRRRQHQLTSLDDIDIAAEGDVGAELDEARVLERLNALIQNLRPVDRQLMVLHLEGLPAEEIAEIAGISPANTHTKLHRIRQLLANKVNAGDIT